MIFGIVMACLVAAGQAQKHSVDINQLIDVFGTPPPNPDTRGNIEQVTVRPTDGPTSFVDKNGASCQCVPYYLCDTNNVASYVTNSSVTGWGLLDIRFGEDSDRTCQESVEICCTQPKSPDETPRPPPAAFRGCGFRNRNGLGVTITGAENTAQFGEFPWVVAMLDSNEKYVGVGALIHPQVVITVAHYATKFLKNVASLKIRAGEWDTQTTKEIYPYQEMGVQEIYFHKDFNPKNAKNDIALLRLKAPFEPAEHISTVCLPRQDERFDSSIGCYVSGWGKNVFGKSGIYAVIMKRIQQDIVPSRRCTELLRRTRLGSYFNLHDSFICAGGEEGKDTCEGDGGAPLVCPFADNRYKLSGLVSWGIECGQQDVPAVYAAVPHFRHWIDDKMAAWGYGHDSYTAF